MWYRGQSSLQQVQKTGQQKVPPYRTLPPYPIRSVKSWSQENNWCQDINTRRQISLQPVQKTGEQWIQPYRTLPPSPVRSRETYHNKTTDVPNISTTRNLDLMWSTYRHEMIHGKWNSIRGLLCWTHSIWVLTIGSHVVSWATKPTNSPENWTTTKITALQRPPAHPADQ